jgi:hypothetical protein
MSAVLAEHVIGEHERRPVPPEGRHFAAPAAWSRRGRPLLTAPEAPPGL